MNTANDKFVLLREHLADAAERGDRSITIDFADIDRMVGGLPATAYTKKTWWSNGRQAQAKAWQDAGWRVDTVGFFQRRVVFARLG